MASPTLLVDTNPTRPGVGDIVQQVKDTHNKRKTNRLTLYFPTEISDKST